MLSIEKNAIVGWDSALTKWPVETCEDLFADHGSKRDDGISNEDGTDWDKASFTFDVDQPGMRIVGTKTDGTSKIGVDPKYTRDQAVADAGDMFDSLGRDKYVRQVCNGFDLGARKEAPPKTTLRSDGGGPSEADKAIWCLFSGKCSKKETNSKKPAQLAELYDAKHG